MNTSNLNEAFRDHLYNTDEGGRRIGFFPKRPRGRFYHRRTIFSLVLLLIFFATPWIKIGDHPFLLFNFIERKFVILGQVFWPQDFFIFVVVFLSFFFSVILFTFVFGRLWCGWACPQTIFLEMVYRKIEYAIEGDGPAQRKLNDAPWTASKIAKKGSKQFIFITIAFLVSNTVLAYVVGIGDVTSFIQQSPASHPVHFVAVILNTAAFYFVFAWFREQACIYVCPYGRLQGVLMDNKTIVISYDSKRGEPRKKLSKDHVSGKSDCIDCKQCIAVCPTGIDIRNGTQLECVNCTACIDACDEIMDKVSLPRGLIRYASQEQVSQGEPMRFTGRMKASIAGLFLLTTLIFILIFTRSDLKTTILRAPGKLFSTSSTGAISNLYTVKVLNKSEKEKFISFRLEGSEGKLTMAGEEILNVMSGEVADGIFTIETPKEKLHSRSEKISIGIYEGGELLQTIQTTFIGPIK